MIQLHSEIFVYLTITFLAQSCVELATGAGDGILSIYVRRIDLDCRVEALDLSPSATFADVIGQLQPQNNAVLVYHLGALQDSDTSLADAGVGAECVIEVRGPISEIETFFRMFEFQVSEDARDRGYERLEK